MIKYKYKEIPIYRGYLVVIICDDVIEAEKLTNKHFERGLYAHTVAFNFKNREGYGIILNPANKYRKLMYGTICHEILHTTIWILKNRSIKVDFKNDECAAYLSEWIGDFTFKVLKDFDIKLL